MTITPAPMLSGTTLDNANRLGLGGTSINPNQTALKSIGLAPTPVVATAPNLTKPMDASKIAAVTPKTYPPAASSTLASTSLGATVGAQTDQATVKQAAAAAANPVVPVPTAPTGRESALTSLLDIFKTQQGKAQDTLDANKSAGVDEKQKLASDISGKLTSTTRAWDDKIEKARTQPGVSADQAAANVAQLEQQKNHELADISIQLSVANGDFNTAKDIAQRVVDAKYEPLQNEINTLTAYYNLSQNDMSESEKMQAQAVIQQKQDEKNFAQQKELASINHKYSLDEIYTRDSLSSVSNPNGTLNGKPQNATQSQVNGYADRLLESNRILLPIGDQFASPVAIGGILPNVLQSSQRQQFEQAKRNFVNATLRRESGAVISPSEFMNADKQYFPQPGDSKDTLLQKASNRNTVINNFYRDANVQRPVGPGDVIESGGKQYQVDSDGVTLIPV